MFNRAGVFQLLPGNRVGCNDFLSSTTCAGGPGIDLYYEDDASGRQQVRQCTQHASWCMQLCMHTWVTNSSCNQA